MAHGEGARMLGDDYQARVFWCEACRLFYEPDVVERVAYSAPGIPGFDDVVTYYRAGSTDHRGQQLSADCRQVKFHKYGSGALTGQALAAPAFIDATNSVLQRLSQAAGPDAPSGVGLRFWFCSPWNVPADDPIAAVWRQQDSSLDIHKLRSARPGSALGRMRSHWLAHLGVGDDELACSLAHLRICLLPTMHDLKTSLNDKLRLAGLRPVAGDQAIHEYDELIRKLVEDGRSEFTASELDAVLIQHDLRVGPPILPTEALDIRIQSFARGAERASVTFHHDLCLLDLFEGRDLKPGLSWDADLPRRLREFAAGLPRGQRLRLHIPAHASIAFTAGYYMDPKTGLNIAVVQPTVGSESAWGVASPPASSQLPTWRFEDVATTSPGDGIAVALSVTHDIIADVRSHIELELPHVGRVILCRMQGGPGPASVTGGAGAAHLSDALVSHLRAQRTGQGHAGTLHLFAAAPNGLMFMLGQRARALGPCQLYEHDLGAVVHPVYRPSMGYPLP